MVTNFERMAAAFFGFMGTIAVSIVFGLVVGAFMGLRTPGLLPTMLMPLAPVVGVFAYIYAHKIKKWLDTIS